MSIADNIANIQEQICAACRRAGRAPEEITLMAVTKTVATEQIREAYAAGLRTFGENRVQEFSEKSDKLLDLHEAEWHMIGHLQSNKAAKAVELFTHVDSVDSIRLAQKLNSSAAATGKKLPVLIEVNIGGEVAKSGLVAESDELQELLDTAPELPYLHIRGLMTVPPYNEDPEGARPYFRKMRALWERLSRLNQAAIRIEILSMGMSHDFEIAIEEGATCIRVGTAIFGGRPPMRRTI
jgi:PLP dependent protein